MTSPIPWRSQLPKHHSFDFYFLKRENTCFSKNLDIELPPMNEIKLDLGQDRDGNALIVAYLSLCNEPTRLDSNQAEKVFLRIRNATHTITSILKEGVRFGLQLESQNVDFVNFAGMRAILEGTRNIRGPVGLESANEQVMKAFKTNGFMDGKPQKSESEGRYNFNLICRCRSNPPTRK